jgi:hypothetical protein
LPDRTTPSTWGHHDTVCRAKNKFCEVCRAKNKFCEVCRAKNKFCEVCSDAHPTTLHDEHCAECAAEAFVSGTPNTVACPRTGNHLQCANCGEKGHGPRSRDCRIFKKRTDARFMKGFVPAIKQGTRVQNTRTRGGVVQAEAERDCMARSGDATVTGVSTNPTLGTPPGTNFGTCLARWARIRLCMIQKLPQTATYIFFLSFVTV